MIHTISEILDDLLGRQAAILDEASVSHRPTIGDMYEGLTRDMLGKAIPSAFKLQIVDGFVEGYNGCQSHQVDAMLVVGESGRKIPFTDHFIWPISDVLATFEIKKTLFGDQLADGMEKSAKIWDMQRELFEQDEVAKFNVAASRGAFSKWSGRQPARDMSDADHEIYKFFIAQQVCPVRVVFGYGGYVDEYGLRSAFIKKCLAHIGVSGMGGPLALPDLIVCGKNSLIKTNGHPYIIKKDTEYLDVIGSECAKPLRLMMELLWTKLSSKFEVLLPMDDTLEEERIVPLLSAKHVFIDGVKSWYYREENCSKEDLSNRGQRIDWEPVEIDMNQNVVIISSNENGLIDILDSDFVEYTQKNACDPYDVVSSLVDARILAWTSKTTAVPISEMTHVVFTQDGKMWASNNLDMLNMWISKYKMPK